jgi:hypothetical protein
VFSKASATASEIVAETSIRRSALSKRIASPNASKT